MKPIHQRIVHRIVRPALVLVCAIALAGCAAQRHHTEGMKLIADGKREDGLRELREAQQIDPTNPQYRMSYLSQQALYARDLLEKADDARRAGNLDDARTLYTSVVRVDPANDRGRRGLENIEMDLRHRAALAEVDKLIKAGQLDMARERTRAVLNENIGNTTAQATMRAIDEQIDKQRTSRQQQIAAQSVMRKPVTLQFRDANLRMVFEALSRTTGLNVIFDRDVRADLKTTIFVNSAAVEDTVDLILLQNQLEKKVLNANTMFIYPATAAKQKEYQDLKVRTFMLSNADPKYIQNLLKSLLKVKDAIIDERTGALVIRDTPDAIAVAEKIIAAHDVPDPEVMLEVEVLEVSRDRLENIGVKWPDTLSVTIPNDPATDTLTIGSLKNTKRDELLLSALGVSLNFKLQDTDANILASPRIRARNKEKAKILIGDKVPVITNSVTPVTTGGSVVTGSVQYLDVGLKLEVEPQVYSEGEVGIKISLEVSNIAKEIAGPNGSLAYQIGTRSAQTSLRLRDGETQILAGLINDQDRTTSAKVPGVGQMPVLGRLFSNNSGTNSKSEIVLSITPRIVRAPAIADNTVRDVYSGTEASVRETPLRLDPIGSVREGAGALGGAPNVMPAANPLAPAAPGGNPAAAPAAGAAGAAGATGSAAPLPGAYGSGSPAGASGTPGTPVNGYPAVMPRVIPGTPGSPVKYTPENMPPTLKPGGAFNPAAPAAPAGTPTTPSETPQPDKETVGALAFSVRV